MALLQRSVLGFLRVVAGRDDGLAVVNEEDVDIFTDRRAATTLGCLRFLALRQDIDASTALQNGR